MNIAYLNRARNATLAAILAAGLMIPTTGLAYADDTDSDDTTTKVKDKLNNLIKDDSENENVAKKTESVYVFANADGSAKNTVVTNWLKNPTDEPKIHDISSLTDIQNTEGKETFEAKGESLIWDAQGNDIYYQGNTDKKAPVELKITYWLDGKETAPADMAGKSGHVKIRFDYQNNSHQTEYIDGAARTVYTPFVCVTGMILDNGIFKNISTKNAKALNDGDRTMVGGYALPGLQEDLDIDKDTMDIPSYFEVEADVENFEMGTTATLVSSNLMDSLNTDELGADEIGDTLNQLSDAMGQLIDGSSQLYEGMGKLDEGGKKLADGTGELQDKTASLPKSAKQLADGSADLADGLGDAVDGTDALIAGNKQISDGLDQLANGSKDSEGNKTPGLKDAADGAAQIKDGLSDLTADGSSLDQLAAGEQQLAAGLAAASGGISQYSDALGGAKEKLTSAQEGLVQAQDALSGLSEIPTLAQGIAENQQLVGATDDALSEINVESIEDETLRAQIQAAKQYSAQATGVANQLATGAEALPSEEAIASISESIKQLSDGLSEAVGGLGVIQAGDGTTDNPGLNGIASKLTDAADKATTIADGISSVKAGLGGAVTGLDTLESGLDSAVEAIGTTKDSAAKQGENATLLGGNNDVTAGLKSLGSGLGDASDGADKLAEGLSALNKAVPSLTAGIKALAEGADQLSDGIGAAKDGTGKLRNGIQQFNDEGIQKIIDAYNDNLAGLGDRLKATVDAGKAYNTFTGKSAEMQGSVKFIYETDAIEIADGE